MFEDKEHSFLLCLVKSKTVSKYLFYILYLTNKKMPFYCGISALF